MNTIVENTKKFSGKADIYAKARPGYAGKAIEFLVQNGFKPGCAVSDIGSGTGIFSKYLLDLGLETYCVEPNDDMRLKAEELLSGYKNFHSINAPAENTTLNDNSVDFITAAQAFHWFDVDTFQKECRRILKPNGKVVLLWNNSESNKEINDDYEKIVARLRPGQQGFSNGEVSVKDRINMFYKEYKIEKFDNNFYIEKETFILKALSTSHSLKPEDANYEAYIRELAKLFDRHQKEGKIMSRNETVLYIGEV